MLINRLGFELEMVQILLKLSLEEKSGRDFAGLRQAATYVIMYWCMAHYKEAQELLVRSVGKSGASLQISIRKSKANLIESFHQRAKII